MHLHEETRAVPMSSQVAKLTPEAARFVLRDRKTHFIDGRWADAQSGKTHEVLDPCTSEVLATIPLGGAADVDAAVSAAQEALFAWSATHAVERAVLLHRLADAIERNLAVLAEIEALDVGKTIASSEGFDIPFGAACVRYFADLSVHANYDTPLAIRNMEARFCRT
jgi:acyl-CoA reductase-like NAD-dependent aldehyde dehydrogenase